MSDLLIRDVLVLAPIGKQTPSCKDIVVKNGRIADIVEGAKLGRVSHLVATGANDVLAEISRRAEVAEMQARYSS